MQFQQSSRAKEIAREDLVNSIRQDHQFKTSLESEGRIASLRLSRERKQREEEERKQTEIYERLQQRTQHYNAQLLEAQILQEYTTAKNAEIREEKLRERIRGTSDELRVLEQKLSSAYTSQERALQISQKKLDKEAGKVAEAVLDKKMQKYFDEANHKADIELEKSLLKTVQYQHDLLEQLDQEQEKKRQEYQQFLKEKAMVDEIVQQILEQDEKELNNRLQKQRDAKLFIDSYMIERAHYKKLEHERIEAENAKIAEYAKLQEEREEGLKGKKNEARDAANLIYDRLAGEMNRKEQEKLELEMLRIELSQAELEEKARKNDELLLKSRIEKKLALMDSYAKQTEEKKQRYMKEKEEENNLRAIMMEKFAADSKLEQLNAQKRRMKQLEHKRLADETIRQRQAIFEAELEKDRLLALKEEEVEKFRQDVVEQERQRLLREHAAGLIGFLPKGVLKSREDLDLFDEEFKRRFEGGSLS